MLKGIVSLIQAQKDAYKRNGFLIMLKRPKKTDVS